jgi:ABC-2 type transport system permease protein
MSFHVVWAFVLRYLFLYGRSPIRLVELFFWPIMELLVWGSLTVFLNQKAGGQIPQFIPWLIGGVIFWDILFRAQQGVAISFLEDVWTKNLHNVFVAPVRPIEYLTAGIVVGIVRTLAAVAVLVLLAAFNFSFNLFQLEWTLLPYFTSLLLFGWSLGMISSALILRWGQAAEVLAWAVPFLIQPAAAVFYPLSTLPEWAQMIGKCFPCTYVFEGMRGVLDHQPFNWNQFGIALVLNGVWLLFAGGIYAWVLESGRRRGMLTRVTSH